MRLSDDWREFLTGNENELPEAALWAGGLLLALLLRLSLWNGTNGDTTTFLIPWYDALANNGGWRALKLPISNYTPPYLYLLTLATYLPLDKLHAIKLIAFSFDFALAYYVMRLVQRKRPSRAVALMAFLATLFAPTVFLNSAYWGQCDAIYTTFLLAALYYTLQRNPFMALTMFGVAFSCKLQAVFFLPFFVFLYLKRELPARYFALIPAAYLVLMTPAWLIGRPLRQLLTIYAGQTGTYEELTKSAANFYQWLPNNANNLAKPGILFALGLLYLLLVLLLRSRAALTDDALVKFALTVLLLVPYTLPRMHERYFFAADVCAIVYAFYFPRYWYVPALVILCSLLSYGPFLFGKTPLDFSYLALILGLTVVTVTRDLVRHLFPLRPATTMSADKAQEPANQDAP